MPNEDDKEAAQLRREECKRCDPWRCYNGACKCDDCHQPSKEE